MRGKLVACTCSKTASEQQRGRHQGLLPSYRHELRGIATDRIELETRVPHKLGKTPVSGKAHPVAVPLQSGTVRNEWLYIT